MENNKKEITNYELLKMPLELAFIFGVVCICGPFSIASDTHEYRKRYDIIRKHGLNKITRNGATIENPKTLAILSSNRYSDKEIASINFLFPGAGIIFATGNDSKNDIMKSIKDNVKICGTFDEILFVSDGNKNQIQADSDKNKSFTIKDFLTAIDDIQKEGLPRVSHRYVFAVHNIFGDLLPEDIKECQQLAHQHDCEIVGPIDPTCGRELYRGHYIKFLPDKTMDIDWRMTVNLESWLDKRLNNFFRISTTVFDQILKDHGAVPEPMRDQKSSTDANPKNTRPPTLW